MSSFRKLCCLFGGRSDTEEAGEPLRPKRQKVQGLSKQSKKLVQQCMRQLVYPRQECEIALSVVCVELPKDLINEIIRFLCPNNIKEEFIRHIYSKPSDPRNWLEMYVNCSMRRVMPVWEIGDNVERDDEKLNCYFTRGFTSDAEFGADRGWVKWDLCDRDFSFIDEIYWIRYATRELSSFPAKMHNVIGKFSAGLYFHYRDDKPNTIEGGTIWGKRLCVACRLEDLIAYGLMDEDRIALANNVTTITPDEHIAHMEAYNLLKGGTGTVREQWS